MYMTQQNLKKLIKILLFVFIIQSFVFAEEKIKYTKQNDKIIFYQNGNEIAVVDNNVIQENEDAICWNLGSDYFLYNKKKGVLEKELDWAYINEYGYVKKMNGKFYFTNKKGKTKIIISDYSILTPLPFYFYALSRVDFKNVPSIETKILTDFDQVKVVFNSTFSWFVGGILYHDNGVYLISENDIKKLPQINDYFASQEYLWLRDDKYWMLYDSNLKCIYKCRKEIEPQTVFQNKQCILLDRITGNQFSFDLSTYSLEKIK